MTTTTPQLRLSGRVCIVTGSSSGLGRSIALSYSREGAILVCADLQQTARAVNGEESISTVDLIKSKGGKAIFVQTDVSKAAAVEALVAETVANFGRIDVLVNNAGIAAETRIAPSGVHETPEEVWDANMTVNVKSVFLTSKYTIAQMLKQEKFESGDRGWIINLSSVLGLVGGFAVSSYSASKGAIVSFTRAVALDYAKDGIHCNAICPGFTETAFLADARKQFDVDSIQTKHPLHGFGMPQDIADAAVFLASQEARWITGVCLPVDGGYTAQ